MLSESQLVSQDYLCHRRQLFAW